MQERTAIARYNHLPLGNMPQDWAVGTADALFARCLQDAGQVLWAADSSLPDPAGKGEPGCTEGSELLEEPARIEVRKPACFSGVISKRLQGNAHP